MNKLQTDRRQQQIDIQEDKRVNPTEQRQVSRPVLDDKIRKDISNVKNTFAVIKTDKDTFTIKSIDDIKSKNKNNKAVEFVGDLFPSTRRVLSVEENKDNRIKALGLGMVGLINLKEDIRDILSILGLTKSQAPKGYYSRFKFFSGTLVEKYLEKSELGKRVLIVVDASLADTYWGEKLDSYLKITPDIQTFSKEIKYPFLKKEILQREYVQLNGKLASNILSLTLHRITKIGLGVAFILEIPAIVKSVREKKNYKQISRSLFNVSLCSLLGALTSSLLTVITGSPAGSVIGLGLGIYMGNQLTKKLFY